MHVHSGWRPVFGVTPEPRSVTSDVQARRRRTKQERIVNNLTDQIKTHEGACQLKFHVLLALDLKWLSYPFAWLVNINPRRVRKTLVFLFTRN